MAIPYGMDYDTGKKARANKPEKGVAMAKTSSEKKKVTFSLFAPNAGKVVVSGSFCNWDQGTELKKDAKGTFKKAISLEPGKYEYRFIVDDQWENDPENLNRCINCFGTENNILIVE